MVSKLSSRLIRVLALALLLTSTVDAADEVPWAPDLETARQVARQMNHLVLLHFWSHDCVPCRRLDATVFADREFAHRLAAHYVPVKINVTKHPSLAYQYGVRQWPTDVITTPDGRVVHKMVVPSDSAEYVAILERVGSSVPNAKPAPDSRVREAGLASYDVRQPNENSRPNEPPGVSRYSATAESEQASPYGQRPPNTRSGSRTPYDDVYDRYTKNYAGGARMSEGQFGTPAPRRSTGTNQQDAWQGPTEIRNQYAQGNGRGADAGSAGDSWGNYGRDGSDNSSIVKNKYVNSGPPSEAARKPYTAPPNANRPIDADRYASKSGRRQTPEANTRSAPRPKTIPTLAMDGYCPVTLIDGSKWVKGDARFGLEHRGRTYLFHNEEAMRTFWANPDRFSPALSGSDPVALFDRGQHVAGKRQHGLVYKDQVYLFGSEQALNEFYQAPDRYAEQVRVATRAATADERVRR